MGDQWANLRLWTAHAFPRTTHPAFRMVVDRGPPATRGDHRADAGRDHPFARGEPAGGDQDRARSVSFLQPPCAVSAAVLHRDDRGVVPVAAADSPYRADRVR